MKRLILAAALVLLASCGKGSEAPPPAKVGEGGPPPIPPYQMRAAAPSGNRLAGGRDGQALFENRCGTCHLAGGMGTNLLTKQRMALGEPPENALLAKRTDLTADYVKLVVRMGKNAMPPQTRVDITDAELDAVSAWLGKDK
jgi:mono/diheme cytochrome c family protein